MIVRDPLMDIQYFDAYVARETQRVENFERKLANGELNEDRVQPVKKAVHSIKLGRLIARYSRGDDLGVLREEYLELLEGWQDVFSADFYSMGLQMLSLGVLFRIDLDILKPFTELYKAAGVADWLYDFLVSGGAPAESITSKLQFPKVYGKLKETLLRGDFNSSDIEAYLKDWYKNHRSCGWHDSHKSKQMTYHGYWSMEIGAVAKLLGIDDAALQGVKYYPFDLVHF